MTFTCSQQFLFAGFLILSNENIDWALPLYLTDCGPLYGVML